MLTLSGEAAAAVWDRWLALAARLAGETDRLVFAHQVHGTGLVEHGAGWRGILRVPDADGHLSLVEPTALVVTLADCVPVFIAHPNGATALLHSGWKGTAGGITTEAIRLLSARGLDPADLVGVDELGGVERRLARLAHGVVPPHSGEAGVEYR